MVIEKIYRQHSAKWVIKWNCSNCGYDYLDSVGFYKPTVSMDKQMECPKCKSFGKDDYKRALMARIDQLTEQRSVIDIEIDKITKEVEQIEIEN